MTKKSENFRLNHFISSCGVTSRRKADTLIFEGKVSVNGEVEVTPGRTVDPSKDIVELEGKRITFTSKKVYYVLNKPRGYVCSHKAEFGQKTVYTLFEKEEAERLFSIGRLDEDTSGLLLLTSDGEFAQQVIHPSKGFHKEYLVKTKEAIDIKHLEALREGFRIDGDFIRPVKVEKIRNGTLKIVVREGKKREIRRLVQFVGLHLETLSRIRIGELVLGSLPIGAFRPMTDKERNLFLQ